MPGVFPSVVGEGKRLGDWEDELIVLVVVDPVAEALVDEFREKASDEGNSDSEENNENSVRTRGESVTTVPKKGVVVADWEDVDDPVPVGPVVRTVGLGDGVVDEVVRILASSA